jgi:predicted TIM-barrel fold metal-dependent hydrolase
MERPDLELLRGAIDMHAHTSPALFKRHIDDAALAESAAAYGMRGFVLKDHDSSTTGRAYYVNRMFPGVESIGAVVLNRSVGGLNPYVAEAAVHYGARVVWMPSNHAKHHAEYFSMPDYPQFGRLRPQLPGEGVTVFEEDGKTLKAEARTICEIVAENDVAMATGHISLAEIRALLDAAREAGVTRFIVTHANWSLCKLDLDTQRELIAKGATIEYVASSCVSPIFWEQNPDELARWIVELEGEHIVLGSDLGQYAGPPHPEGLRMLLAALLEVGVPYEYLEKMTKANCEQVLGLEPGWSPGPAALGSVPGGSPAQG